jgi:hypothetical protein
MRVSAQIARVTRQRRSFSWPKKAENLLKANRNAGGRARYKLISSLARMTGYPRNACLRFARRCGFIAKRPYRNWSPRETDLLLQLSESHKLPAMARKLKRSCTAVRGMLERLGIKIGKDGWTKYVLASFLHVRPQTVQEWVDRGWLKAHKEGTATLPRLVIRRDDFLKFFRRHPDALLQGDVREDRLEFIFEHVVPRSHVDHLPVRPARKDRAARRRGPQGEKRSQDCQRGRKRRGTCRTEAL